MSKILILYYSQSGQLTEIAKNFAKPFEINNTCEVTYVNLIPVKEYEFPWTGYRFFDVFPESVEHIPCELKPIDFDNENFDLIIFAYSVWYMSPSIPSNSFLFTDVAKRIFKDKPVITLIGSRNMWVVAQEYIKEKITELGGKIVGNIVLCDRAENLTGIVTISYFMFSGKKDRFLGFFPKPGISKKDIEHVDKFGEIVLKHFQDQSYENLQENLVKAKAVKINPYLATTEQMAYKRVFTKWSKFILKKGGPGNPARKSRVRIFACYFPFAILVIAPIEYVFFIIFAPFRLRKIKEQIRYFSSVELKLNR